jgi:hypothetical protein
MNNLFEGTLQEQLYKRTNKLYYHVSARDFEKFEARNEFRRGGDEELSSVFLTPNYDMILQFAEWKLDEDEEADFGVLYLYLCRINRPLNIFNPSNKTDVDAFMRVVMQNPRGFYKELYTRSGKEGVESNLFAFVKNLQKRHDWQAMENPAVVKLVKEAGYDGFASTENFIGNLAVFDPAAITIMRKKVLGKEDIWAGLAARNDAVDAGTYQTKGFKDVDRYKIHYKGDDLEKFGQNVGSDDFMIVFKDSEGREAAVKPDDLMDDDGNLINNGRNLTRVLRMWAPEDVDLDDPSGTYVYGGETFDLPSEVMDAVAADFKLPSR